ncbi:hypothetical protein TURU_064691 [Turdus rufiventris]|nr:hypothetical protein TURU_064691 [Turdus rufiventris]
MRCALGSDPWCGQQERGILCSGETPPAELSQLWEQHRRDLELLERSRGAHGDAARAGAPLEPGWGAGDAHLEKKKSGETSEPLPGPKGVQESWRETWDKAWRDRTQGMAPTAREQGWVGFWDGILGWDGGEGLAEGAQSSWGCPWIPGMSKARVDIGTGNSLGQWEVSLPWQGGMGWDQWDGMGFWDGMGWDGMGWDNGMGWDQWDGIGCKVSSNPNLSVTS